MSYPEAIEAIKPSKSYSLSSPSAQPQTSSKPLQSATFSSSPLPFFQSPSLTAPRSKPTGYAPMNDPLLWIDPLHDLSVRYAAQSWGKDLPETWGIISRAIQSEDLSNPVPAHEFTRYVQTIAKPVTIPTPAPVMEIPKTKTKKSIKNILTTVVSIIAFCFFFLLAYGWIKDTILFPIMYAAAPTSTNTPFPLRSSTNTPVKTPTPNTSISLAFPECFHWSEVVASMKGQDICVFGVVNSFYPTNETSTRINFSDEPNTFFVFDVKYIYPDVEPGWCILINGKVELSQNTPFIKITEGMYAGVPPKPSDCE